jgi:heme/copper-type cytochrome/quinol oxidase subunit 2
MRLFSTDHKVIGIQYAVTSLAFLPVWFTPTIPGEYEIACSQLCGLAHFRMRGTIVVESAAAFRAFLDAESAASR